MNEREQVSATGKEGSIRDLRHLRDNGIQRLVEPRARSADHQVRLARERLHGLRELIYGHLVYQLDGITEGHAKRDGDNRQQRSSLVPGERRKQQAAAKRCAGERKWGQSNFSLPPLRGTGKSGSE